MTAFNLALMSDGTVLVVVAGATGEAPIEVFHLTVPGDAVPAVYVRSAIVLRKGGRATLVERHIGLDAGAYLANGATDIVVEESASLLHVKVQTESAERSEEHTSELQSLMRISYAVFCLKKKNIKNK